MLSPVRSLVLLLISPLVVAGTAIAGVIVVERFHRSELTLPVIYVGIGALVLLGVSGTVVIIKMLLRQQNPIAIVVICLVWWAYITAIGSYSLPVGYIIASMFLGGH